jgi:uncharacterized protein (TIGR02145 family)
MSKKLNRICASWLLVFGMLALVGCKDNTEAPRVVETGTVTDVDGNVYKTVKIGNQWWMAENLSVTHFNDGSTLDFFALNDADTLWANAANPSYTVINDSLFGYLYNFNVVENVKNIAPEGWHVPTDEDWKILEKEIGMSDDEANALGWRGSNEAEKLTIQYSRGWPEGSALFGTDEYGFQAKPAGCRLFNGEMNYQGNLTFWWTASTNGNEAWYRYLDANQTRIFRQHTYKGYGMSIRCVKNS